MAANSIDREMTTRAAGSIAVALARVIVPLWFVVGAVLKLMDLSPTCRRR